MREQHLGRTSFCAISNEIMHIMIFAKTPERKGKITHLLTHSLTPYSTVLLEKLTNSQLIKKFPVFYGTWRFITTFTSARHLSLYWACSIQSTPPQPTSWRSILILPSHLRLGLPSSLFPSGFPTKALHTHFSPIRATCPAHLILHFITRTILGDEYRSLNFGAGFFLF